MGDDNEENHVIGVIFGDLHKQQGSMEKEKESGGS